MTNNLILFLEKHQDEANQELDCCAYLMKKSIDHFTVSEFGKAAAYHENIARSLHELQCLRNEKQTYDQAIEIIKENGIKAFREVMKD